MGSGGKGPGWVPVSSRVRCPSNMYSKSNMSINRIAECNWLRRPNSRKQKTNVLKFHAQNRLLILEIGHSFI